MVDLWKPLYPFKGKLWDRGGLRLHYLDEGSGEPVVMVHGNPSWSFYFRELVKGLRGSHRVIVPDHIGMGLSDKPNDAQYEYTLKSRVDDLEGLLAWLGVKDKVTLVVHDWGGAIGLAYACRNPGKVRRLVVMNTAAFFPPPGKPLPRSLWLARTPLGPLLVRGLNGFCLAAARYCVTRRPMPPEVRAGYLAPYDSWSNRVAVMRFVQDIPQSPGDGAYDLVAWLGENLGRVSGLPMMLLWGAKDFVFDVDFLEEWSRRFPAAEVRVFPDAGHYVLEDASEEIVPLVKGFLEKNPLPSAV